MFPKAGMDGMEHAEWCRGVGCACIRWRELDRRGCGHSEMYARGARLSRRTQNARCVAGRGARLSAGPQEGRGGGGGGGGCGDDGELQGVNSGVESHR